MRLGRVGIIDELDNNAGSYRYAGRPAKDKQGSRSSLSVENFFFSSADAICSPLHHAMSST